ncbi:sugar transferase [Micromonospora humi]|uniref:Sugar transferase involved in LPS biosynthesis (Colanic, teichoic acid) n=1 Tax=Micromonospora humi TaxID=745366 RepID=A0A1C5K7T1_9ACTN|nr:sugar transferase [Micromonospora humi]SCG78669.1 Sugar transferase involved in LPS biosynthesis (colanic, teichoic acid) [Micromonospora humi]
MTNPDAPRRDALKRLLDVCLAGIALVVSAPVSALVALAVLATMGRPVLFRQVRPGRGGTPFELVKFRSMRVAGGDAGPAGDAARLTGFGRWLRSTSLDELPSLWNVLRGDMSLVGPRPLLPAYLDRYTPEQFRRHDVRPGVTGWQQVNGRNAMSWDERFRFDVWYVDNRNLALDLRILAQTVVTVLRREGISGPGSVTVEEFRGTPVSAGSRRAAAVRGLPR